MKPTWRGPIYPGVISMIAVGSRAGSHHLKSEIADQASAAPRRLVIEQIIPL
jgi:hypothetical protein